MTLTKQDQIEQHLLEGKPLTSKEAWLMFGHSRLASVVHRMRDKGINVRAKIVSEKGSVFARYKLEK